MKDQVGYETAIAETRLSFAPSNGSLMNQERLKAVKYLKDNSLVNDFCENSIGGLFLESVVLAISTTASSRPALSQF